ncbi:hypothetical protein BDZ45DRAFT_799370 [Acephala macrosclerotiorum]|nr:hypothetical protein BDZ45DRAFT_799370 [Acephala macrosclerotiorum]
MVSHGVKSRGDATRIKPIIPDQITVTLGSSTVKNVTATIMRPQKHILTEDTDNPRLAGLVVDEDTCEALERSEQMTPEHLLLIDAILTLPETTLEKECQRRIAAINAITAYCDVDVR